MPVTSVTAFRATDGALFVTAEEAELHQAELDIGAWYASNELVSGRPVAIEPLLSWLFLHRTRIASLLGLVAQVEAVRGNGGIAP